MPIKVQLVLRQLGSLRRQVELARPLLAGIDEQVTDDARQTIRTMGRAKLLPHDFAERIGPMVGFRNVVVHEYLTVDPAIVYRVLHNGLAEFEQFAQYIEEYLRREGHLPPVEPTA